MNGETASPLWDVAVTKQDNGKFGCNAKMSVATPPQEGEGKIFMKTI